MQSWRELVYVNLQISQKKILYKMIQQSEQKYSLYLKTVAIKNNLEFEHSMYFNLIC